MNIIEEFYYGNLNPGLQTFDRESAYGKASRRARLAQEHLRAALDDSQRRELAVLEEAFSEMEATAGSESYIKGFRTGARFILDTFLLEPEFCLHDTD